ncbi:MAG: VanZ family protein [Eubacterium sp.]|nr:VanZ family protein [Eubacterium sp.]
MKHKVWILRVILIVLIIGWMFMIFDFSAEDGEESQSLSDQITIKVVHILKPNFDSMPKAEQKEYFNKASFIVRKIGHFGEYGLLGLLVTGFLLTFEGIRNLKKRYIYFFATLWCALYALTDEAHQLFVEGRSARIGDVFVDMMGGLVAAVILVAIWKKISKRKKYEEV